MKWYTYIKDSGKGMSPKSGEDIFESYTKSEVYDGIGPGLTVTKELVEIHGGTIFFDSKLGEGSTFTFSLLLSTEKIVLRSISIQNKISNKELSEEKVDLSYEKKISKKQIKSKILIVDDDHVNLRIVSKILSDENYDLLFASKGEVALEKINVENINPVITDIMMPVMSGFELTEAIRRQYDLSELPIIMFTARARLEDMSIGYGLGANDYVVKPIDAFELKARVRVLTDLQTSIKNHLTIEAAWLRAQINPHFLVNSLTAIMMLAIADIDKMQHILIKDKFRFP